MVSQFSTKTMIISTLNAEIMTPKRGFFVYKVSYPTAKVKLQQG